VTTIDRSPYRTQKLSEEQRREISRRYSAGETGTALAREFNVHPAAIYYHLHQRVIVSSKGRPGVRKDALKDRLAAVQAVLDSWDDNARERIAEAIA
jgi:hypothetical protein